MLEIGLGAAAEDRSASLALIYDELLRKEIENKCGQLGDEFDMHKKMVMADEVVLRWARRYSCLRVRRQYFNCAFFRCCREWDKTHKSHSADYQRPDKRKPVAADERKEQAPAKKPKVVECWKCGGLGHYANQCKKVVQSGAPDGRKSEGRAVWSR